MGPRSQKQPLNDCMEIYLEADVQHDPQTLYYSTNRRNDLHYRLIIVRMEVSPLICYLFMKLHPNSQPFTVLKAMVLRLAVNVRSNTFPTMARILKWPQTIRTLAAILCANRTVRHWNWFRRRVKVTTIKFVGLLKINKFRWLNFGEITFSNDMAILWYQLQHTFFFCKIYKFFLHFNKKNSKRGNICTQFISIKSEEFDFKSAAMLGGHWIDGKVFYRRL